jgi:hypothetical protein
MIDIGSFTLVAGEGQLARESNQMEKASGLRQADGREVLRKQRGTP